MHVGRPAVPSRLPRPRWAITSRVARSSCYGRGYLAGDCTTCSADTCLADPRPDLNFRAFPAQPCYYWQCTEQQQKREYPNDIDSLGEKSLRKKIIV